MMFHFLPAGLAPSLITSCSRRRTRRAAPTSGGACNHAVLCCAGLGWVVSLQQRQLLGMAVTQWQPACGLCVLCACDSADSTHRCLGAHCSRSHMPQLCQLQEGGGCDPGLRAAGRRGEEFLRYFHAPETFYFVTSGQVAGLRAALAAGAAERPHWTGPSAAAQRAAQPPPRLAAFLAAHLTLNPHAPLPSQVIPELTGTRKLKLQFRPVDSRRGSGRRA